MSKEEILLKELTRLLSHIAPEVEPASDVVDVYWQVDNAVCGLLKERHLTPRALDGATLPDNQQVFPADVLVGEGTFPEPPRQ